jgi:uncharacterized protein YhaN
MRIVSLRATKVGRWSPQTFQFGPGLTVVYGPNEAGKSTALRALEALLFPVETRGSEGFAALTAPLPPHQFDAALTLARVGADGATETIQWRRKGKSLLDEQERPVLPEVAHAWLWETSQTDFRTLYALGHDRLRDHQGLLGKDSALGRVLTEMATGGRNLAFYQAESQTELERQYKPKGKNNHRLNNALLLAEQAIKNVKKADETRGHLAYQRAKAEQQTATTRRAELEQRLTERRAAVGELDRLAFAPPQLEEISQKSTRIEELRARGPVPSAAFCEAMTRRRDGFETLRREHESARQALHDADQALRDRVPSSRVLDVEDRVERVIHLRPALVAAPERRAQQRHEASERARTLQAALTQLGLPVELEPASASDGATTRGLASSLERWVPPAVVRAALEKAFQALVEAEDAERTARHALTTLQESHREQTTTVARLSPADESEAATLRAWKTEAEEAGNPQALGALREATRKRTIELELRARQLGFAAEIPLARCAAVRLPAEERLAELRAAFERATQRSRRAELAFVEASDRARDLAERSSRTSRALPPDLDLGDARRARDEAWQALRETDARSTEADPIARVRSVAAFERAERRLDETVDGVLLHANAVAELAELRRTHAEAAGQVELRGAERAAAQQEIVAARASWEHAFADTGLAPPAVEQLGFLRDFRQFLSDVEAALVDEAALTQRERAAVALADRLRAGLVAQGIAVPADATFRHLVQVLDERLGRLQTQRGAREAAEDTLTKLARDLERAAGRLQAAETATLGARAELSRVAEAAALPETLAHDTAQLQRWIADGKSLAEQLRAWKEAERGVVRVDDEHRAHLGELDEVVALLVGRGVRLPGAEDTPLARLDAIVRALREARETRSLEENREKAGEIAAKRARAFEAWQAEYRAALGEAGLDEAAYTFTVLDERDEAAVRLTELLARSAEIHRAEAERKRMMLEASRAAQLDFAELVARVAGRSQASLADEKAVATRQIAALEDERRQAHEAELAATQTVQAMEVGGDHDTLRQAQEGALASLAEEMRATLTAKGATLVLGELADALTAHDQRARLLERASRFLATVTVGAFTEVRTDDEDGLLVVRAGTGETLSVSALSEGTRDQVYLALRLAVAEGTLETKRLPFLLDDVLVHFDDARAVATLRAFEALARHTQVILFTHHDHLLERARAAGISFETIVLETPPTGADDSSSPSSPAAGPDQPAQPSPRLPRRPALSVEAARSVAAAQLELLTPALPPGSEETFLAALAAAAPRGEKVSTSSLKKSLAFDDGTFNAVRAALLASGRVVQDGRSLRLVEVIPATEGEDQAEPADLADDSVGGEPHLDK